MGNTIGLTSKYIPMLDELYALESKTAVLDGAYASLIKAGIDDKTIYIPDIVLSGLGDYTKDTGYSSGDVTLSWSSHQFSKDRSKSFSVDRFDNLESAGVAFGVLAGEFVRTKVVPEIDQYRITKYVDGAGTSVQSATPTSATAFTLVDTAIETMNDAEVPEDGRVLFVSNSFYSLMKQNTDGTRFFNVQANNATVNRNIEYFENMQVVRVPATRFTSTATFGSSGYTQTGNTLNFMIVHKNAVINAVKNTIPKYFSPDENQSMDSHLFQYRIYHDCFVPSNKTDGIYYCYK